MTKSIYVKVSVSGPTWFSKANYQGEGTGLNLFTSQLTYMGYNFGDKYVIISKTAPVGWYYGYYTESVGGVSYDRPADLLTAKLQIDDPDSPGKTIYAWDTVYVSDGFQIPLQDDITGLSGPVHWTTTAKTSIDFGNLSWDGSSLTLGGYSLSNIKGYLLSNAQAFVENGMKSAGFGGLLTSLQNTKAATDFLLNGPGKAIDELPALLAAATDPNATEADVTAIEQRILKQITDAQESAFNATVLAPGSAAGDALAHQLIRGVGVVGNGLTINGGFHVDFQVGLGGGVTLNTSAGADWAYAVGGAGDDSIVGNAANNLLLGGAGNDSISVSGGKNFLGGGTGSNVYNINGGVNTIDGAFGTDTAVFAQDTRSNTAIVANSDGSIALTTKGHGSDTLYSVEQVRFSDGLYSFDFTQPSAPVVANFNQSNGWTSQDQFPRHLADVNGDGYADIVGFGSAGVLVSYGSASGKFSAVTLAASNFGQTAGWASDNSFHRVLTDVNGDGRADIVGFGYAGTLVSLAKSDGTYGNPATGLVDFGVNQGWGTQTGFARTMGDVNGDGKADIVGFGYAGTLVALGNGDGTFQPVRTAIANFGVNQGWTSDNAYHRAVADVNGDGKADIVGFGQAGTWVAISNGDGTFADAKLVLNDFGQAQGWSSNDGFTRLVADVNGDHVADIVGFGIKGTLVAFGTGNGNFTPASLDLANFAGNQGWTSDNIFHREVTDVNGDGMSDIVGFGAAGVLVGRHPSENLTTINFSGPVDGHFVEQSDNTWLENGIFVNKEISESANGVVLYDESQHATTVIDFTTYDMVVSSPSGTLHYTVIGVINPDGTFVL